ncbi:divalent-cation tolerance protein CutA [Actinomadura barringtoniae]|uniref:Divalent-cation tolerance protein CutA n=1 Tax=Actinomadura barringtoniae TaxID=1427535 RepID=A0A939PL87_9ACTN|nr:divalent-cation tolerance protein CutA [Actinomadura barringtoniae]MBO2454856.1 divalent-cation tolerance protein CutA [Actinomadura barringtoniae]
MTDFLQVSTTTASREEAMNLLRSAVGAKLAASGQVFGPAGSVFWHLGELGDGEEWQLFLRTTRDRYADLEAHLIEHHPWDNPEVTFTVIDGGSERYLEWLSREASSS